MAKILIPTPLRKFTKNNSVFETQANTVDNAIKALIEEYQDLSQHLLDEQKNLRSFIRIYVGDEDINGLQNGSTPVQEDSEISIIPAIAGGI